MSGGSNAQWRRAVERARQQQRAGCARSGSRASSPSPPAAVDEGRQRTVEGSGGAAVPLFSPRTPLPNPLSPYFSQSSSVECDSGGGAGCGTSAGGGAGYGTVEEVEAEAAPKAAAGPKLGF